MKSRIFVTLLVFIFVILVFASPCIADPPEKEKEKDRVEKLFDKIEDIKMMLDFLFTENQGEHAENAVDGYLMHWIKSKKDHPLNEENAEDFKWTEAGEGALSDNVITDPDGIVTHAKTIIGKTKLKFYLHKVSVDDIENNEKHDAKTRVVLRYKYKESPDKVGQLEFTLFHMKICIWW